LLDTGTDDTASSGGVTHGVRFREEERLPKGRIQMRLEIAKAAAIAAMVFSASSVAQAAEKCDPTNLAESGTFTAHAESVGFLVSVHWGDGVLTLNNGEAHKFSVIGGKLIETGFGETHL
jgi:hypothetical protein